MKFIFKQIQTNKRVRQAAGLFSVNIVGLPIGIITSIIITRYLGPQAFGDFKFLQSIFSLAIVIFTFGLLQAGNRALVLNNDKRKSKEYYGALLIIVGGLFIAMALFLIVYALFDPNVTKKQLNNILLYLIPFSWIFLLNQYFEILLPADNRIRMLAQVRLLPKLLLLVAATVLHYGAKDIETNRLALVFGLYLFVEAVIYISILINLKITINNMKVRLLEIFDYNKSFGFDVYVGSLFAVGFSQFTYIIISYFSIDNTGVGFYSLALALTMPLGLIPNTIATTHYKDFSDNKSISKKLLSITLGLSLAAFVCIWVVVPPFVTYFYGAEFESVIFLSFIVSIGVITHGFGDFFNRYLGANGQGKALRNSSFIVGGGIMSLNLLFIPMWGEQGAAYAKLINGFVYIIVIFFYYFNFKKEIEKS